MRRVEDLQLDGLKIIQEDSYFCFGIDAVLLSDFVKANDTKSILDIGCGNGILPLLLVGKKKGKNIVGIEIQSELANLALENVRLNKLEDRISIVNTSIQEYTNAQFDVIVTNPPYMKYGSGINSDNEENLIARFEKYLKIEELFISAKRLLKEKGSLFMVHRADRIVDIICEARKSFIEPKEIRFIKSKINDAPKLVLIKFIKGAGEFLKILPDLVIYEQDGRYTEEILKIYGKES